MIAIQLSRCLQRKHSNNNITLEPQNITQILHECGVHERTPDAIYIIPLPSLLRILHHYHCQSP